MTVREALKYAQKALSAVTEEAANEAGLLVSFLSGIPSNRLALTDGTVDRSELDALIEKRCGGIPVQYLMGKWWFYKGEFFVGDGVLIPRQDTETLVETACELLRDKPDGDVADLCAGTGCIGISIAAEYPDSKVVCIEKYEKAFSYLQRNIVHNAVSNVRPVLADVCDEVSGRYDLIVSNPPYITSCDMAKLSEEVKKEPHTALFGGEDGLYFYRVISKLWKPALKKGGILAFEVGIDQAASVAEIMKSEGFERITVRNDLCGVQRVVFGTVNNI